MEPIIRRLAIPEAECPEILDPSRTAEWLVTNGLGGYASGTVAGPVTRRYHGLLVAALPAPLGRIVMLSGLIEEVHFADGRVAAFNPGHETANGNSGVVTPREFRLEMGLPIWRYEFEGFVLEKRIHLPYRQNTVHISYRFDPCTQDVELKLRPLIQFRQHEEPVTAGPHTPYVLRVLEDQYEISTERIPPLRLLLYGRGEFVVERKKIERVQYPLEAQRGYESVGDLWTPGSFHVKCSKTGAITLVASAESWEVVRALSPRAAWKAERERRDHLLASAHPKARSGVAGELVLAADQFVTTPAGRLADATRAHAAGHEVRTIIAGYHWFTDWGRDAMISLEGLTLITYRATEAAWILRNFANAIRDGLIPNLFPEHSHEGLYHTADATLWFFHAMDRYLEATGDRWMLRLLLPRLIDIAERHLTGTRFRIGVDPADGLLRQGEQGYQLTWMDAKVGDWVVTPRRGKAVEINALWYNALMLLQQWLSEENETELASHFNTHARRARASFNERFWYSAGGYLYDVIDGKGGDDTACRPNQLLAISLRHPVLDPAKWESVLTTVRRRLVTPVGLRSLSPDHPEYKPNYFGDLRARDAAYHQGTTWAWLVGPLIDAWLKVYPEDTAGARRLLEGFISHLNEACIGSISEIFDAEAPYTPRGCIAQAWSVAEVLRCWVKTEP